ncbi:hypothetical protein [Nannocystis bainbridge]|uniref:Lipoprotein n=1 Tax=Nannocystis bainbridge TaxID=2995303 RepID=A0ABT5EER7_9BACT|nr:hypothetical protein [Nannocystis bainbridge]MDC0723438.1 hypothetical protein [Nannocystis bainbridge]
MKRSTFARTAPCLTLVLALACQPDAADSTTDGASDSTTLATTGTDTDAPTTTETTSDEAQPAPCDGIPPALASGGAVAVAVMDAPDEISVQLSDDAITCAENEPTLTCKGDWFLRINLPLAVQTPGNYALSDLSTLALTGVEECNSSTGGNLKGTLQIVSVDEVEVTARLCNLEGAWADANPTVAADFSFVAPRCP